MNVRVPESDIKWYHYLVIFNGSISGVFGKCGRILGTIIFILNISFQNVSHVFVKNVQWETTTWNNSTYRKRTEEEEIRMSIDLPYVKGTSENLRRILRSSKLRYTSYTKSTLLKLLCKPKGRVATEDQNNIVYAG